MSITCKYRLSLALGLGLAFLATSVASANAAARPELVHGKALFAANGCYGCHGLVGQGSSMTGPAINPLPLPLTAAMAYVRHPGGVMPPYSAAILTDADLRAILLYVQSLPKGRSAAEIPQLSGLVAPTREGLQQH